MIDLNKKIQKLERDINAKNEIESRLSLVQSTIDSLAKKVIIHEKILQREFDDVAKLEELNLNSLFVKLLGDIEKRLDKERQEYLHAILRHKALMEEVDILKYEKTLLSKKLTKVSTQLEPEYKALIKQKETILKRKDSKFYRTIIAFDKKKAIANTKLQKLKTARRQGEKTIRSIVVIQNDLRHITAWGNIQAYHGKGNYSSMKKKFYIDKARKKATIAKVLLDEYERLVEQVFHDLNVQLSLESFEEFLDDFFDNLITDWVIQHKIKNAFYGLEMNIDKIMRHNLALENEKNIIKQHLKEIEKERKVFIKSY